MSAYFAAAVGVAGEGAGGTAAQAATNAVTNTSIGCSGDSLKISTKGRRLSQVASCLARSSLFSGGAYRTLRAQSSRCRDRLSAPIAVTWLIKLYVARIVKAGPAVPIVVAATGDAVKSGLVQSYSRPGGNVTGVSGQLLELSAKRMELLKETFPAMRSVTTLWNPARGDNAAEVEAMKGAAGKLGVVLNSQQVRDPQELELVLNTMVRGPGRALTDAGDSLLSGEHDAIVKFAASNKMPAIYDDREYVAAGGLMSYGPICLASIAEPRNMSTRY